MDYYKDYQNLG